MEKDRKVFFISLCNTCALLKPIGKKSKSVFPESKVYCKVCTVKSIQHGIN